MTLKELQKISEALNSLVDFVEANIDRDESGIGEEMGTQYNDCIRIIDKEKYKIYLRNALVKLKRKKNIK